MLIIVKNTTADDERIDVLLTFKNTELSKTYPHDMAGLTLVAPYTYTLPGSRIYVLLDTYTALSAMQIKAGESKAYTLYIQLPHDALPEGMDSAQYEIHTAVVTYTEG